jgi:hypothetical protein
MADKNLVTLFPPDSKPMNYQDVTDVRISGNVISFSVPGNKSRTGQKITTSVPFTFTDRVETT